MKKILIILIATFLVGTTAHANEDQIIDIEKQCKYIKQNQSQLYKKSILSNEFSTEGAELIFYTNNNKHILLIVAEFLGETGRSKHEYYFNNDLLIFLLIEDERYNSRINTISMSESELEEYGVEKFDQSKSKFYKNLYYFHKKILIKWIDDKNNTIDKLSTEFKKAETEYLKLSQELIKKFKSTHLH